MKIRIVVIAILAGLTFVQGAIAQSVLWQKAESGMSPEQVKAVVAEAVDFAPAPGDKIRSGAMKQLEIPVVEIADRQFKASFYFKEKKLEQIMLTLLNAAAAEREIGTFESLVTALKSKYGTELSRKRSNTSSMTSAEATWTNGGTAVIAGIMGIGDYPAHVYVVYNTNVSKAADKL